MSISNYQPFVSLQTRRGVGLKEEGDFYELGVHLVLKIYCFIKSAFLEKLQQGCYTLWKKN